MTVTKRKAGKRFKDWVGYFFLRINVLALGRLSHRLAWRLGGALGTVAWLFWGGYRRIGEVNTRIAFGNELSVARRRKLIFNAARQMVREVLELSIWLRLSDEKRRKLIEMEGVELLREAHREGKGVVIVTAHLSNFPLVSVALTLEGLPNAFVMQQIKVKKTDSYFDSLEKMLGVEIIDSVPRDRCAFDCVKSLRSGKTIIMALDMDARAEGVFADFFGKPASTYIGPLVLARRTKSPVFPAFVVRRPDGRYRVFVHPPLPGPAPSSGKEADYLPALAAYNRLLESYIGKYPAQWNWIGKRWRTRPPGDRGEKLYRKGY